MLIFLSSVNPENFIESEVDTLQCQYVTAFNSWRASYPGNYYYIDNSINKVSDIRNRELLDIFWDVYDFGAVIPHVILSREHTDDKIFGTFKLFELALLMLIERTISPIDEYCTFILGRRKLVDPNDFFSINSLNEDTKYLFSSDLPNGNQISDNFFICRTDTLMELYNLLQQYKDVKNYQSFLAFVYKNIDAESKEVLNLNITDLF
jgi:hypothetical protein